MSLSLGTDTSNMPANGVIELSTITSTGDSTVEGTPAGKEDLQNEPEQLAPISGQKEDTSPSPSDTANLLSFLTFWTVGDSISSQKICFLLQNASDHAPLDEILNMYGKKLTREINICSCTWFASWVFFYIFGSYYLLRLLVVFLEDTSIPQWQGWVIAVSLALCSLLQSFSIHHAFMSAIRLGFKAKAAFSVLLFNKAMRLRNLGSSVGEIVNMLSNDASRVLEGFRFYNFLWGTPVICAAVTIVLYFEVGVGAVAGLATLLLFFALQVTSGRHIGRLRGLAVRLTDTRVRKMSEILTAIKLVKLYAWEDSFAAQVAGFRMREMRLLRKIMLLKALNFTVMNVGPMATLLVMFSVYVLQGNVLTAANAFVTLALINVIAFPLAMMPQAVKGFAEARLGFRRLQNLLDRPERVDYRRQLQDGEDPELVMKIVDGSFRWEQDEKKAPSSEANTTDDIATAAPTLSNISLAVPRGRLVAVVGEVGSGKSSLLAALLGQIGKLSGDVAYRGRIAYFSQQPWVLNSSLRDNILFGTRFDDKLYADVLAACCLLPDLDTLPAGDNTEIGERGINLSGGQKARVALARAIYSGADVLLLDDPLAAVDAHVGRKLFHECLRGPLCRNRTVVLVTHQVQYLAHCDAVVVLKAGAIAFQGAYSRLVQSGLDLASLGLSTLVEDDRDVAAPPPREPATSSSTVGSEDNAVPRMHKSHSVLTSNMLPLNQRRRIATIDNSGSAEPASGKQPARSLSTAGDNSKGKLIAEEDRKAGSVGFGVYREYMRYLGGLFVVSVLLLLFAVTQLAFIMNTFWLAYWTADTLDRSQEFYIAIFGAIAGGYLLTSFMRGALFGEAVMAAARKLHDDIFRRVLRATMAFFDSTPIGRILNRFSKDVDVVDDVLPDDWFQTLSWGFISLGNVVFIAAVLPLFVAVLVPSAVLLLWLGRHYMRVSRELKRLDGISRSPLYSNLSTALQGLASIRAYGVTERFVAENMLRVDANHRASMAFELGARWLGLRLDIISIVIVLATSVFAVVARSSLPAGVASLAIVYSLRMAGVFQWAVRVAAETESQMTSVERLVHYRHHLPLEAGGVPGDGRPLPPPPPDGWPSAGVVEFSEVEMRYRDDMEPVLRGVSFKTNPSERIGIVGRTGAGKSTLVTGLFRMIEPSNGHIFIDNVDIGTIALRDLRSRLAIIPQDPVLFAGTVRSNLDPFDTHTDEELWDALTKVHLRDHVAADPRGLRMPVVENGENFSVGQRQLLCIARALLRHSKILVLDEATASVDNDTDELIQKTIRSSFRDCTVLTIAHRLHTIIDSDRILGMDHGRVVEFASPAELLRDEKSIFYSLVAETGEQTANYLRAVAFGERQLFDQQRRGTITAPPASSATSGAAAAE